MAPINSGVVASCDKMHNDADSTASVATFSHAPFTSTQPCYCLIIIRYICKLHSVFPVKTTRRVLGAPTLHRYLERPMQAVPYRALLSENVCLSTLRTAAYLLRKATRMLTKSHDHAHSSYIGFLCLIFLHFSLLFGSYIVYSALAQVLQA